MQLAESLDGRAESNRAFFQLVLDRRIPQQLASYMTSLFACAPRADDESHEQSTADRHESLVPDATPEASASAGSTDQPPAFCKATSQQWLDANKRPGLLYALQLLRALVSHHEVSLGPDSSLAPNGHPQAPAPFGTPCFQNWGCLIKLTWMDPSCRQGH